MWSIRNAKTEVPSLARGRPTGRCSSCGFDLPGHEKLCDKCYVARYGALAAPQDSFRQSWTTYLYLLLWIFVSPHDGDVDAGRRSRHPLYPANARTRRSVHDGNLHACGDPQAATNPRGHASRSKTGAQE